MERLVGIAIEGIADSIGIAGNRQVPPTREQLQHFVEELQSLPEPSSHERSVLAERYWMLNIVQNVAQGEPGS